MYEFLGGLPQWQLVAIYLAVTAAAVFLVWLVHRTWIKLLDEKPSMYVGISSLIFGVYRTVRNLSHCVENFGAGEAFGRYVVRLWISTYMVLAGVVIVILGIYVRHRDAAQDEKLSSEFLDYDENEWKRPRRDDDSSPER